MSRPGSNMRGGSLRGLLTLLMLSGLIFLIYPFLKKKIIISSSKMSIDTSKAVYLLLKARGYTETLSRYMTAQASHETAVNGIPFESFIFKNNNNCFGMKYAKQINGLGEKNGYANYLSIDQSVQDFGNWYNRRRNSLISLPLVITTLESYVNFMKNNKYFEAPESEYLKGVQYFYNKLFIQ